IVEDPLEAVQMERGTVARERPLLATGQAEESRRVLLDLLPARERIALRPPGGGGGEKPAEVPVARAILDQQPERPHARDRRLRSDQCTWARASRRGEETRCAVDALTVAQCERVVAERRGALDQILGQPGAAQEAERAATAQLDV